MIFNTEKVVEEKEEKKIEDKIKEAEEKKEEDIEEKKKEILKEENKQVEYVEDIALKDMNPLEREVFKFVKSEGYVEEQKDYKAEDNYSGNVPALDNAYFKKEEFNLEKKDDDERRRKQANI